jgi:hypothetical protein
MLAFLQKIDLSIKKELINLATSANVLPDEYEITLMIVTKWLLESETMSENMLLAIDRKSKVLVENVKDRSNYLEYNRKNLVKYGQTLLKNEISKIRAKVAFMELVALIAPDEMIPILVNLSTKYLGSEYVQKWIVIQQQVSHFSSKQKLKNDASENLTKLTRAIEGDRRKTKKRKYSYWKLSLVYENLSSYIKGFRKQNVDGKLDKEFYKMFLEHHEVPSQYHQLILTSNSSPKQLTLEIMVSMGLIENEKAFKDFQPTINQLQKKHFNGNVLSIADEIKPIVFDFIDIPTRHPESIRAIDPISVLEKVPLKIIRPNS